MIIPRKVKFPLVSACTDDKLLVAPGNPHDTVGVHAALQGGPVAVPAGNAQNDCNHDQRDQRLGMVPRDDLLGIACNRRTCSRIRSCNKQRAHKANRQSRQDPCIYIISYNLIYEAFYNVAYIAV